MIDFDYVAIPIIRRHCVRVVIVQQTGPVGPWEESLGIERDLIQARQR